MPTFVYYLLCLQRSQLVGPHVQKPGPIRDAIPELRDAHDSQVTSSENKQASEADGAIDVFVSLLLRRKNVVEWNAAPRHVQ